MKNRIRIIIVVVFSFLFQLVSASISKIYAASYPNADVVNDGFSNNALNFKNPIAIGIVGILVLLFIGAVVFKKLKRKYIHGFGRIELNIMDEDTSEVLKAQFRNLNNYSGSFTLFEVLEFKEEYEEAKNLKFVFRNDDGIEVVNKSECIVERSGRRLDSGYRVVLYDKNRITVLLNKIPKSIIVEFHTK
ncbi:hypothetical protein D4Z93_01865 [Clostridium fermenticellae]|uniref:Uncharacterized protein n=1 Tax=Clostridium fermenticellae TaxID=2068654 RepID=A0A386H135_9CLOT|nr:hypothetical protein [Clostridium fermenticellae]AYD39356.1 hypothetical protein D4Z93_01865 [Clostridium fermenticellae]